MESHGPPTNTPTKIDAHGLALIFEQLRDESIPIEKREILAKSLKQIFPNKHEAEHADHEVKTLVDSLLISTIVEHTPYERLNRTSDKGLRNILIFFLYRWFRKRDLINFTSQLIPMLQNEKNPDRQHAILCCFCAIAHPFQFDTQMKQATFLQTLGPALKSLNELLDFSLQNLLILEPSSQAVSLHLEMLRLLFKLFANVVFRTGSSLKNEFDPKILTVWTNAVVGVLKWSRDRKDIVFKSKHYVNVLKWALEIISRICKTVHGMTKSMEEFLASNIPLWTAIFMELLQQKDIPDVLCFQIFRTMSSLCQSKKTSKYISQNIDQLLFQIVIPNMMGFDDNDIKIWKENPEQLENLDYYSGKTKKSGALVLLETLLSGRGYKGLSLKLAQYVRDTLMREDATDREKDAALCIVSPLSFAFSEHSAILKEILDQLIPLFSSECGFLRAKACLIFGTFAEFLSSKGETFERTLILNNVIECLSDPEVPVKHRAVGALGQLILNYAMFSKLLLEPVFIFENKLTVFLDILKMSPSDEVLNTVGIIIETLGEKILPYAETICTGLIETYTVLNEKTATLDYNDNDNIYMAINEALNSIQILLGIVEHGSQNLRDRVASLLLKSLFSLKCADVSDQDNMEFVEILVCLIESIAYSASYITPLLWEQYDKIISGLQISTDYLLDFVPTLCVFIERDPFGFVERPLAVQKIWNICQQELSHGHFSQSQSIGALCNETLTACLVYCDAHKRKYMPPNPARDSNLSQVMKSVRQYVHTILQHFKIFSKPNRRLVLQLAMFHSLAFAPEEVIFELCDKTFAPLMKELEKIIYDFAINKISGQTNESKNELKYRRLRIFCLSSLLSVSDKLPVEFQKRTQDYLGIVIDLLEREKIEREKKEYEDEPLETYETESEEEEIDFSSEDGDEEEGEEEEGEEEEEEGEDFEEDGEGLVQEKTNSPHESDEEDQEEGEGTEQSGDIEESEGSLGDDYDEEVVPRPKRLVRKRHIDNVDEILFFADRIESDSHHYQSLIGLVPTDKMEMFQYFISTAEANRAPKPLVDQCIKLICTSLETYPYKLRRLPEDIRERMRLFIKKNKIKTNLENNQ